MVQLSAMLASWLGQRGTLSTPRLRLTVACGAAAGIAAGHGLRLAWWEAGGGALRELTVVATYPWGPGVRSDTFVTLVGWSP